MARIDWIMQRAVSLIAIGLSLWHLAIVAGFLAYSTIEVRVIHITLLLVLVFLVARPASLAITDDATAKPPRNGLGLGLRLALAATAIGVGVYTYVRWKPIAFSGGLTNDTDALVGLVLIALVMIAVVRRIGWLLAIIAGIFLIYPFVSEYLPSIISTRGYGWETGGDLHVDGDRRHLRHPAGGLGVLHHHLHDFWCVPEQLWCG
jgi:TRAP-type uncharacterized transport system fused permease subunit